VLCSDTISLIPVPSLAAKDNALEHRHAIEEAMSEALIRKCPKCTQACVKEAGCNKMMCQTCRTMFCYVCRATIKGYDHFDQSTFAAVAAQIRHIDHPLAGPANYREPKDTKKCRLWDPKDKDPYQEEVSIDS
jgi:TRIAD3 protein (E3 ubiquitin-protein ligase RNF216)